MSKASFEDNCDGCMPVILDTRTRKPFPEDSAEMKELMDVWRKTTLEERKAFHAVCCNNSREPETLRTAQVIAERFQNALIRLTRS